MPPKSKTHGDQGDATAKPATRQLGFAALFPVEASPDGSPGVEAVAARVAPLEPGLPGGVGIAVGLGDRIGAAFTEAAQLVVPAGSSARAAEPSGLPPVPAPVPAPRVFGVSELMRAARLTMEGRFSEVRVEGEVSGFKRSGPGHFYFTLKDDQSCMECVMYARDAAKVRFTVDDGMAVRLRGRLTIYEGRGRFQMSVAAIEPTGAGALAVAFEQLKQKLQAEGLFATARKRRLPFLPRRIGVVTSPQGAVIRDIIRVAHRRFPMALLLAPTPVQGPAAAPGIVAALARLAAVPDVDLIIVARGGGSMDDLWCFNEEAVARAIAACRVPVISAVGHETDFTIADFVADVRAPTPSAAAEMATPVLSDLHAELLQLRHRSARGATVQLRQARLLLERGRTRLGDPRRPIGERRQRIDELVARAHRATLRRFAQRRAELAAADLAITRAHPHRRIGVQRALLVAARQHVVSAMASAMQRRRVRFDALGEKLSALSPRRVLERGYSLAFTAAGHVLTDAREVEPGARVRVVLQHGELGVTVVDAHPERPGDPRQVADAAAEAGAADAEPSAEVTGPGNAKS